MQGCYSCRNATVLICECYLRRDATFAGMLHLLKCYVCRDVNLCMVAIFIRCSIV